MHCITQNGVNALRLRTRTLHKRYTDFTQQFTQDETISGLCPRTYALTNLVMRYPGFAVPLMFASNLLKGAECPKSPLTTLNENNVKSKGPIAKSNTHLKARNLHNFLIPNITTTLVIQK